MPPLASCRLPRRTSSPLLRLLHSSPKADVVPRACHLESRSVLAFTGTDTFKFLQGLLTNDVRQISGGPGDGSSSSSSSSSRHLPALYAARLTPQGRFLYDMMLYRPSKERSVEGEGPVGFELFADVDASVVDEVLSCLKRYRLRSNVEVEDVTKEFSCWQHFGGNVGDDLSSGQGPKSGATGLGSGVDCPGASSARGSNQGWRWFKDPRLSSLGFRGIFPAGSMPPLVEIDQRIGEEHCLLWRLKKGVAEGSLEIPSWESIPLEYNLVGLNAINFDKGCYVGQEFIARTHHRGVIRKRLLPLKFTNGLHEDVEQTVAPGSEVVDSSNKKVGTVSRALGSCGIGVLRLVEAFSSPGLRIKDQEVKVKPIKPDWWPAEWTHDLE